MSVTRRRFAQEFNDELCREVISTSKPIKDVADAYGVGTETELSVPERAPYLDFTSRGWGAAEFSDSSFG